MSTRRRTPATSAATAGTPTTIAKRVTDPIKDLFDLPDAENPIYEIWNPPGLDPYAIKIKKSNFKSQVISKFNTLLKEMITENKTPILPEELMNMSVEEIRDYPEGEKLNNTLHLFGVNLSSLAHYLGIDLRYKIRDRTILLNLISNPDRMLTLSSKPNYLFITHYIYKSLTRTDETKFEELIERFKRKITEDIVEHNSRPGLREHEPSPIMPVSSRGSLSGTDSSFDFGSPQSSDFSDEIANNNIFEIRPNSHNTKFNIDKVIELTRDFYIKEAQNRANQDYDINKILNNGEPIIKETPIKKYFKKLHLNKNAEVLDFITRDNYTIEEVLKDPDYLLFVYRNKTTSKFVYFITTRDYIKNFVKDRSNIFYECLAANNPPVIHPRTDVYFSSNNITSMTKALYKLSQIKTLLDSDKRIFIMSQDDPNYDIKDIYKNKEEYPKERVSIKHVFSDVLFIDKNHFSRTHCNENSNEPPYDIFTLYYVDLNDVILKDGEVIDAPASWSRVYSDNMRTRRRRSRNGKKRTLQRKYSAPSYISTVLRSRKSPKKAW
jgi:hypothetical protein